MRPTGSAARVRTGDHMTPAEKSAQARAASHASWARCTNRVGRLENARAGLEERIARQYGIPDGLPAREYAQRLESAKRAYFGELARRSAKSRARRRAERAA